jgi:hypothetical protein
MLGRHTSKRCNVRLELEHGEFTLELKQERISTFFEENAATREAHYRVSLASVLLDLGRLLLVFWVVIQLIPALGPMPQLSSGSVLLLELICLYLFQILRIHIR